MIEPRLRNERILLECEEPDVAVLLLDLVLGYGSHPDPAGAVLKALESARERGGYLSVVASLTGTVGDYQNLEKQREKLLSIGCRVMPSNYRASRLAVEIARREEVAGRKNENR